MNINNSSSSSSDNLNKLMELADASQKLAEKKLKENETKNITYYRKIITKEIIPEWAINHHLITAQLDTLIKETQINEMTGTDFSEAKGLLEKCKQLDNEVIANFGQKILEISPKTYMDENKLFTPISDRKHRIPKEHEKWHEHLGLLMNTYFNTKDSRIKKEIEFLVANYLAKAAPPRDDTPIPTETSETFFHKGLFQDTTYHREDHESVRPLKKHIQQKLNHFMYTSLTDSKHIDKAFPLRFFVPPKNPQDWTESLVKKMEKHLQDPLGLDMSDFLKPSILFDFTPFLEDSLFANGQKDEKVIFDNKLKTLEELLDQSVQETVTRLQNSYPQFKEEEDGKRLLVYIRANIGCVCRSEMNNVGVLTYLPIFQKPTYFECSNKPPPLMGINARKPAEALSSTREGMFNTQLNEFLNATGLRLGAVKGRQALFDFMSLEEVIQSQSRSGYQIMEYAPTGKNMLYYPTRDAILKLELFSRCLKNFNNDNPEKPYLKVLGGSTLDLVKGLLEKIDQAKWDTLNENPDTRQLLQTSLFRIMQQHLGNAEMHSQNFGKFIEEIELIHYEIADLLAIVKPYKKNDFEKIYKQRVMENIPHELQDHVQVGLSKSAMNTFAGVNVALLDSNSKPERAHSELAYHEEEQFLGSNRSLNAVLNNNNIKKVDLYVGEFNHNLTSRVEHNKYTAGDVIGDINKLLTEKSDTDHLTVALDCTIDYQNSKSVKNVLEHFSKEIQNGKLNFVIFRSGQKYDMLGMDNYYGSPFYIVNNGDKTWDPFKTLTQDEAFKTDDLSYQWFCLINEVAPKATDQYRQQIFQNARAILKNVPPILQPGQNPNIKVCQVDENMLPAFIDIKITTKDANPADICEDIQEIFIKKFTENNVKIHSKASFGFFHPNFSAIPSPQGGLRNLRINPGIDPSEVKLIIEVLEEVAKKYAVPSNP